MVKSADAKSSASEVIREGLRREILEGALASGTQLRQDELAQRFGTSRIPVREALRQLEVEGLVTLNLNKGATVAGLSLEEVLEMLEIRSALECKALQLAVPNMIDSDFETLEEILDEYQEQIEPMRWSDLNQRFHEALYAPCHRPKLLGLIAANYSQVNRFVRRQVSTATGKEKPQREHRQILEAAKAGDAKKAAKLLEEHILHTQKSLLAATRQKPTR